MLEYLSELFTNFFDLLFSYVGAFHSVANTLAGFLFNIPTYFFWLPAELVAIITIVFGVAVLYKVVGREG